MLTPIAGLVTTGAAITLASSTTSKGKKKKHKKGNNRKKKKKTSKKKKYRASRYYEMGYDDGYNDGVDGGAYEDDFYPSTRLRGKARCDYLEGYTEGYDDGFIDGRADYTGRSNCARQATTTLPHTVCIYGICRESSMVHLRG